MPTVGEKVEQAGEAFRDTFVAPFKSVAGGHGLCFIDTMENKDKFVVDATAAGFPREKLNLTLRGHQLYIEGEAETNEEDLKGKKFLKHELARGPFRKTVELPTDVDPNHITAKWENGLVHLVMDRVGHETDMPPQKTIPLTT